MGVGSTTHATHLQGCNGTNDREDPALGAF
jgi:hypothetical protein